MVVGGISCGSVVCFVGLGCGGGLVFCVGVRDGWCCV